MRPSSIAMTLAALVAMSPPAVASADTPDVEATARGAPRPQKLGLFAGSGYLASPGASGAAFMAGVRLAAARNLALSFDLGYGMLSAPPASVQDRWWLIPAVALAIPAGRARFDLGAGLGVGTASGYPSWGSFTAAPFSPAGAFQLFPAGRVHAVTALALSPAFDVFARVDFASLFVGSSAVGFRTGSFGPGIADTTWLNLALGVQFRLL